MRDQRFKNKALETSLQSEREKHKLMWQLKQSQEEKFNKSVDQMTLFRDKAREQLQKL